jgi:hypothetical protein
MIYIGNIADIMTTIDMISADPLRPRSGFRTGYHENLDNPWKGKKRKSY